MIDSTFYQQQAPVLAWLVNGTFPKTVFSPLLPWAGDDGVNGQNHHCSSPRRENQSVYDFSELAVGCFAIMKGTQAVISFLLK